jgi:polyhydroxyalkanoate synthesis regulator phasin
MFEDLKKAMDKGMEYAFMTRDKIEKTVKDFAKENNLNKEEAKKLLDQVIQKSEETWKNVEEKALEIQKSAIEKMNLVTKEDYKKLEDRIKKLESSKKTAVKPKVKEAKSKKIVQPRKKV